MASSDEKSNSAISDDSDRFATSDSSDEDDTLEVHSEYVPYQDEPIVESSNINSNGEIEVESERDLDGLTPETLAARQDGNIPLQSW